MSRIVANCRELGAILTENLAFFGPCSLNSQLDNSYLDETENSNLATDPAHASLLAEMEAMLKEEVTKWIV